MSCDCCSTCNCDRCLDVVPVTQETNNISLTGAALTLAVSSISSTIARVTFTASAAGNYRVRWWLTDGNTATVVKSQVKPTNPSANEGEIVATDAGVTLDIENTGALRTWYLQADLGAGIVISDAITKGV